MEGSAAPNGASGEQEGTAADVGAPVASSVGSVFDGATPGSGAGRTVLPVQPGNRWVIYYDKNGVELQRKPKGPGRLPRGATLEGDSYIVRDCYLNKNQEVMTVAPYVPAEQRSEKERHRLETESFLGDLLPFSRSHYLDRSVAGMAAGLQGAPEARLPPRAVRLKTDADAYVDNPYAKYRGSFNAADRGPHTEAPAPKGASAYGRRGKSLFHFPAPVPAAEQDDYDKGYTLLQDGGRGEYTAPQHQQPGEEQYGLTLQGVFALRPPKTLHADCAPPPPARVKERREKPRPSETTELPAEPSSKRMLAGDEPEEDVKPPEKKVRNTDPLRERDDEEREKKKREEAQRRREEEAAAEAAAAAAKDAMQAPPGTEAEDEEEREEDDAEAAAVVTHWRSLGAPGADPPPQMQGVLAGGAAEAAEGEGVGAGAAEAEAPALWLEGRRFSMVEVLRSVQALGGVSKVHCWSLVGDKLLLQARVRDAAKKGTSIATAAAGTALYAEAIAVAVRKFAAAVRLDLLEAYVDLLEAQDSASGARGGDTAMGESGGTEKEKLVVMEPQGVCHEVGQGLLVREGRLRHAQLERLTGGAEWCPSAEDLEAMRHQSADRSWNAQKKWWVEYQAFARGRNSSVDNPSVLVSSACGQAKAVVLFALYHSVRARGGLEKVVSTKALPALAREMEFIWTPSLAFALRRAYVRHLYAFEVHDLQGKDITIEDEHDVLFCIAVKASTASDAAALRQVSLPLDRANLGVHEGLAGVSGSAAAGVKRVEYRTAGNHAPEDAWERQRRLCRALDSCSRSEAAWALGVLTMSSWEAAKGVEPHVVLTDAMAGALARYLRAALLERPPLVSPRFALMSVAGAHENMQANVAAVLTVVGNFSRPGHLTAGFAYNRDLMDALGMCLVRGGDAQRHETLDVLAHMALPPPAAVAPVPAGEADHAATASTVHRAHRGPPQWFVELLPEANVEMLDDNERPVGAAHATINADACPLSQSLLDGLIFVGSLPAGPALFANYLRVLSLLVEVSVYHDVALSALLPEHAVECSLVDVLVHRSPSQAPAFDFIAAAAGPSTAFKYRLSNCTPLVSNLVHVCVHERDGRLQQAYAARALACLLNSDSAALKARLLLQKEELVAVALSTNATRDVATDMAQVLLYFSAVQNGTTFRPFLGAARKAAAEAAALAAASQVAAVNALGGRGGGDESDDDEGQRTQGQRGSGKYRCGVCGQIKKGHICPGYWVEGDPK